MLKHSSWEGEKMMGNVQCEEEKQAINEFICLFIRCTYTQSHNDNYKSQLRWTYSSKTCKISAIYKDYRTVLEFSVHPQGITHKMNYGEDIFQTLPWGIL